MAQAGPWVDEIIEALRDLGGEASLAAIYKRVKARGKMKITPAFDATIRRNLQWYSSNSKQYKNKGDFFCAVDDLRNRKWALRPGV
jgi:putative restriction endonuclease